jgi:hypothetical protein
MSQQVPVDRALLGWLAGGCLLGSLILILTDREQADGMGGALLRIGIVLGALWLFIPRRFDGRQMASVPWWGIALALGGTVILTRVRVPIAYFVVAVAVFVVLLWFVKPRSKRH